MRKKVKYPPVYKRNYKRNHNGIKKIIKDRQTKDCWRENEESFD